MLIQATGSILLPTAQPTTAGIPIPQGIPFPMTITGI